MENSGKCKLAAAPSELSKEIGQSDNMYSTKRKAYEAVIVPDHVENDREERSSLVGPISAARWLLVIVLLAGIYFFHGFIVPVLAALVIGFASWPLYRRLLRLVGGNRTMGATLALLLVVFFIITPISLTAVYAIKEIRIWVT